MIGQPRRRDLAAKAQAMGRGDARLRLHAQQAYMQPSALELEVFPSLRILDIALYDHHSPFDLTDLIVDPAE